MCRALAVWPVVYSFLVTSSYSSVKSLCTNRMGPALCPTASDPADNRMMCDVHHACLTFDP